MEMQNDVEKPTNGSGNVKNNCGNAMSNSANENAMMSNCVNESEIEKNDVGNNCIHEYILIRLHFEASYHPTFSLPVSSRHMYHIQQQHSFAE